MRQLLNALMVLSTLLTLAPSSHADDASNLCLADSIEGQVLKTNGRLTQAREYLERCAAPACEPNIRARCAEWRDEVIAKTPVLQIHPEDDLGRPLADVVVRIDGLIVDPAKPVPLDLGSHELRAEHAGRRFELLLPDPKPGVRDIKATIDLRSQVPARPVSSWVWVLGTTAAVGLVAFGAFSVATLVQQNDLQVCSPYCDPSSKPPLQATEVGADIGLGIGVAAALAATFVYVARPTVMREVRLSSRGVTWAF
jgi:hypothetical protein